jgi:hypothetical protein
MGSGHLHHLAHDRSLGVLRIPGVILDPGVNEDGVVGQGFVMTGTGPYDFAIESQVNVVAFAVLVSGGAVSAVDQVAGTFTLTADGADPVSFEIIVWTTRAMGSGVPQ